MKIIKVFETISKKINPLRYWKKKGVKFGKNVIINSSVSFGSEPYLIEIGDNCKITSDVCFISHDGGVHVFRVLNQEDNEIDLFRGKTIVGDNTFIGNRAAIMPGVKIGKNCIIGFGSIVSKDIPDNSVACGVPARVIESIDEYRDKNNRWFLKTKKMSPKKKKDYLCDKFQ